MAVSDNIIWRPIDIDWLNKVLAGEIKPLHGVDLLTLPDRHMVSVDGVMVADMDSLQKAALVKDCVYFLETLLGPFFQPLTNNTDTDGSLQRTGSSDESTAGSIMDSDDTNGES